MQSITKQVKPGFTKYQPHPNYSWALNKMEGKGKLGKTKDLWKRSEKLNNSENLEVSKNSNAKRLNFGYDHGKMENARHILPFCHMRSQPLRSLGSGRLQGLPKPQRQAGQKPSSCSSQRWWCPLTAIWGDFHNSNGGTANAAFGQPSLGLD